MRRASRTHAGPALFASVAVVLGASAGRAHGDGVAPAAAVATPAPARPPHLVVNDAVLVDAIAELAAGEAAFVATGQGGLRLVRVSVTLAALGLREGDVITALGERAADTAPLAALLQIARVIGYMTMVGERQGLPFRTLVVFERPASLPPAGAAAFPGVRALTDGRIEVARAMLRVLESDARSAARIVPVVVGGKQRGYKLYAIRPGSALAALGLQNGDAVVAVDGEVLDSHARAAPLWRSLLTRSQVTLELTRRERPVTLAFVIVD